MIHLSFYKCDESLTFWVAVHCVLNSSECIFVYDGGIHTIKCQFTGILMLLFDRYLDVLRHFVWEKWLLFV